ncbi:MAG TPA: hypothetical protein VL354_16390 [Spirochaetia bacterium]|nr:hypothetical protein [Spirochaetia bacterium]
MKSCRLLLDDGLRAAASCLCVALRSEVNVVDAEPVWAGHQRRIAQIDMPTFLYGTLAELAHLRGASVETLLRSWIEEHARRYVSEEGRKIAERCRLLAEWELQGFADARPDLRYFAQRLASA